MKPAAVIKTKRTRAISTRGMNTFQKIQAYYSYPDGLVKLSESEDTQRRRYLRAYELSQHWFNKHEISQKLMKMFGVSYQTALMDIRKSEQLFAPFYEVEKEYVKGLLFETYKEGMRKARSADDLEMIEKFGNRIEKLMGFDKEENNLPFDPEDLKPHTIVFTTDPKVIQKEIDRINNIQSEIEAEFVDYEEA